MAYADEELTEVIVYPSEEEELVIQLRERILMLETQIQALTNMIGEMALKAASMTTVRNKGGWSI
jgi:hypothetical protein